MLEKARLMAMLCLGHFTESCERCGYVIRICTARKGREGRICSRMKLALVLKEEPLDSGV